MASFQDSNASANARPNKPVGELHDQSIGALISQTRNLSAEQVEKILSHQRQHGVRFGEAAVNLGYASTDDVLFALAQQFHYPYAPDEQKQLSPELVALTKPFSNQAEAFRAIRSQLMMRLYTEAEPRRALAVISPEVGDGKSYFAANLALTLAQLGGRTLLVDADMRTPRQHELFKLENREGLSAVLSGRSGSQVIQQIVGVPALFVLPVGITPPNPLELVERPAFGLLMRELLTKFDYVVVDTPAASHGADSAVIAAKSGASLVIARKNQSKVQALQDLVNTFEQSPAKLVGVIVNEF